MTASTKKPKKIKGKRPSELTTEETMNWLFPKKVRDKLKEIAHEKDDPPK